MLHLCEVLCHELLHFALDVLFSLFLDNLLVIFELSGEEIRLGILEIKSFKLDLLVEGDWLCLGPRRVPSILDLVRVYKPHIVAVVPHKLRRHLQKLQLAHLLQKEAHFQALHVGVTLELLRLEEHELVDSAELVVADFFGCGFVVSRVERRFELHSDVVLFGRLGGEDARLDVVDDHFVATRGPAQVGAVVEELFLRDRVRRLLNFAAVDLGEGGSGAFWL